MPIAEPTTAGGAVGLAAIVGAPAHALFAFDFDGVLAPIVDDPEQARVHPAILPALCLLAGRLGSVAIVTGRPAAVAVELGGFRGVPELAGLTVFGQYGRERWDAASGDVLAPPPDTAVSAARDEAAELLRREDAPTGVRLEDKGSAFAVHTRRAADPQAAFDVLRGPLSALAARYGLVVEPGRLVLEIRPPGVDKGQVLRAHARDVAARAVGYVGDDLGDLAAFAAVDALRTEGIAGLKICSGSLEVPEMARQADLVLDGPTGVATFLADLADLLDTRPA